MQELKDALRDSVYEAPEFFDTWLPPPPPDLVRINRYHSYIAWDRDYNTWRWDIATTEEHPYQNIRYILSAPVNVLRTFDNDWDYHDRFADFVEHHGRALEFDYEYGQDPGGPAFVQCFRWAQVYRPILDKQRPKLDPSQSPVFNRSLRNLSVLELWNLNRPKEQPRCAHWKDVKLVVECQPKHSDFVDTLVRTVGFVRAQLIHQYWCKFAYAMFFIGTQVTFLRVERSGVIHSPTIDVLDEPERFLNAFSALLLLDYEQLGRDDVGFCMSGVEKTKPVSMICGEPKPFYFLRDMLFQQHDVFGASKVTMRGFDPEMHEDLVITMSWASGQYWREGAIMKELRGLFAIGRSHVYEEFVSTGGMGNFRYSLRARPLLSQGAIQRGSPPSRQRWHLNCLLVESGQSLDSITEEAHYATAMIDIIFAIWALKNRGICHRNINPSNIIVPKEQILRRTFSDDECDEEYDRYVSREIERLSSEARTQSDLSELRRLQRHDKRFRWRYHWDACVKLVGFSEASYCSGDELYTRRVGAGDYMACTLLDPINDAKPMAQHFVHDLESLFWIAYLDLGLRRAPDEPTNTHIDTLVNLKTKSYEDIRTIKRSLAASPEPDMGKAYGTAWAHKTGGLVKRLCNFWLPYLQPGCTGNDAVAGGEDAFFERLIDVYEAFKEEVWAARRSR